MAAAREEKRMGNSRLQEILQLNSVQEKTQNRVVQLKAHPNSKTPRSAVWGMRGSACEGGDCSLFNCFEGEDARSGAEAGRRISCGLSGALTKRALKRAAFA